MNMHLRFYYYLEKYIYTQKVSGAKTLKLFPESCEIDYPLLVNVLIINSYHEEELHGKFSTFLVNVSVKNQSVLRESNYHKRFLD